MVLSLKEDQLRFDPSTKELRLAVRPDFVEGRPEPPAEAMGMARLRMAALKSDGHIDGFSLHEEQLATLWQHLQGKNDFPEFEFTLASGFPRLSGVIIEQGENRELTLSINTPLQETAQWSPNWLIFYVEHHLHTLGVGARINAADLIAALMRKTQHGETIERFPLSFRRRLADGKKPYGLFLNKDVGQIDLVIARPETLSRPQALVDLVAEIEGLIPELYTSGHSGYVRVFHKAIANAILRSSAWPQSLYPDLPLVLLAALALRDTADNHKRHLPDDIPRLEHFPSFVTFQLTKGGVVSRMKKAYLTGITRSSLRSDLRYLLTRGLVMKGKKQKALISRPTVRIVEPRSLTEFNADFMHAALLQGTKLLEQVPSRQRMVHALTLCVGDSEISAINTAIQRLYTEFGKFRRKVRRAERQLYMLNTQFFPLTRQMSQSPGADTIAEDESRLDAWTHAILRELVAIEGFHDDPYWIMGKLFVPVTPSQIKTSLEFLKKNHLIVFDKVKRTYTQSQASVRTEENVNSEAAKLFHRRMLQLALDLMRSNFDKRGSAGSMLAIAPAAAFPEACAALVKVLGEIFALANATKQPRHVYQLNVQLLPLLQPAMETGKARE